MKHTFWVETPGGGVRPASMEEFSPLYDTPEGNDRRVALDEDGATNTRVSTVFLGIDHRCAYLDGPPVLYESMVFRDGEDCDQERYCTRAEALVGHARMCSKHLGRDPKSKE